MTDRYHVPVDAIVDRLIDTALACRAQGSRGSIDRQEQEQLRSVADILESLRDHFVSSWKERINRDEARGHPPASARELLDVDALAWAVGLEDIDPYLRPPLDAPARRAARVLMRAAATVGWRAHNSPYCLQVATAMVTQFRQAALLLIERHPESSAPATLGETLLDDILATEDFLRNVKRHQRPPGRARKLVEREHAGRLIDFLRKRTRRALHEHAAALLAVACPNLSEWRTNSLRAAWRSIPRRERPALDVLRADQLSPAARAVYLDELGARLRRLLGR